MVVLETLIRCCRGIHEISIPLSRFRLRFSACRAGRSIYHLTGLLSLAYRRSGHMRSRLAGSRRIHQYPRN
jgi:hypothetical protein